MGLWKRPSKKVHPGKKKKTHQECVCLVALKVVDPLLVQLELASVDILAI